MLGGDEKIVVWVGVGLAIRKRKTEGRSKGHIRQADGGAWSEVAPTGLSRHPDERVGLGGAKVAWLGEKTRRHTGCTRLFPLGWASVAWYIRAALRARNTVVQQVQRVPIGSEKRRKGLAEGVRVWPRLGGTSLRKIHLHICRCSPPIIRYVPVWPRAGEQCWGPGALTETWLGNDFDGTPLPLPEEN
jgi:hypothetical protein